MSGKIDRISKSFTGLDNQISRTDRLEETGKSLIKVGAAVGGIGAAGAYGLYKMVDAAATMQGEMAHVATAVNDGALTTQHLNEVQERAEQMALRGVISTDQLADAYYIARSNLLGHKDALEAIAVAQNFVTGTAHNAAEAQANMMTATRTLTALHNVYGVSLKEVGDQLAALQTRYGFAGPEEITGALQFAAASAHNAGIGFSTMNAALGLLSTNMITGSEAGETLQQVIINFTKGGAHGRLEPFLRTTATGAFDLVASFKALNTAMASMNETQREKFLSDVGFQARSQRAAAVLVDQIGKLGDIQKSIEDSAGAATEAANKRRAAFDEQLAILGNAWEVLKENLGTTLLPSLTALVQRVGLLTQEVVAFVQAHKPLVETAVRWAAIGSAVLVVTGALTAVTGALMYVGGTWIKVFQGAAAAIRLLGSGLETVALRAMYAWEALMSGEGVMAALDALLGPIGLVALAIAGIGIAAYEVYEHWAAIKPKLLAFWDFIKPENLFGKLIPEFFTWGGRMIEELGLGILHGVEAEIPGPLKALGDKIMRFLPHSPAEEGPLADLDKVDIVGEIIQTIQDNASSLTDALGSALSTAIRTTGPAVSLAGTLGGSLSKAVRATGPAISRAWEGVKSLVGAGHAAILHGLMGTESSYGRMLTNPLSSAIGPYQMTRAFRAAFGVTPAAAMDIAASTEVANRVIFERYLPEFGGDMAKALSAWHQGEGWVRRHGVDVAYVNNVIHHITSSPAALTPQMASVPASLAPQITSELPTGHASFPGSVGSPPVSPRTAAQSPTAHTITIHYAPNINGTGMNHRELLGVLRQHSRELGEIVARGDDRRRRLTFE